MHLKSWYRSTLILYFNLPPIYLWSFICQNFLPSKICLQISYPAILFTIANGIFKSWEFYQQAKHSHCLCSCHEHVFTTFCRAHDSIIQKAFHYGGLTLRFPKMAYIPFCNKTLDTCPLPLPCFLSLFLFLPLSLPPLSACSVISFSLLLSLLHPTASFCFSF